MDVLKINDDDDDDEGRIMVRQLCPRVSLQVVAVVPLGGGWCSVGGSRF